MILQEFEAVQTYVRLGKGIHLVVLDFLSNTPIHS